MGHTEGVRALLAALLVLVAATGSARADDGAARAEQFWDRLIDPDAGEIDAVLERVRTNREQADRLYPLYDGMGRWSAAHADARVALWRDLEAMLRWALERDPRRLDLQRELGLVLFAAGRPGAEEALAAFLAAAPGDRPLGLERTHLALLHARRGESGAALALLRRALEPQAFADPRDRPRAVFLHAGVLMDEGRLAEAIDLLEAEAAALPSAIGQGALLIQFALAVAYDRDEQISRALAVLERIERNAAGGLRDTLVDPAGDRLAFASLTDRLYFGALRLEALGYLIEARAEWDAYARVPGTRYGGRARAHRDALGPLIDRTAAARRTAPPGRRAPPPPKGPFLAPPPP